MALQTLNSKQIRENSISDKHIKGKLTENVLDIKWGDAGHAMEILKNKVILDFVQYNQGINVTAGTSTATVNLSIDVAENKIPGVILNRPLKIRTKGEPITDELDKEIVAKLVNRQAAAEGFDYSIKLFKSDGVTAFTPKTDIEIEIIYPVKTTLWDAAENFASNERFVDGIADIRSRKDLEQLARDIYGPSYEYNADGEQSQTKTLMEILLERTTGGNENTESLTAIQIIDEVFAARGGLESLSARFAKMNRDRIEAIETHETLMASKEGAGLVGTTDAKELFEATTVEGTLQEIGSEIKEARGSKETLSERLAVSLRANGQLTENAKIHRHDKISFKLPADSTDIVFQSLSNPKINGTTIKKDIDEIDVYINGALQAEGFNYTLHEDENYVTGITFSPETIETTDIVTLKWTVYNE